MYVEIMQDYRSEVEKYCIENALSTAKVFSAPCAHNNEQALLYHVGPPKGAVNGMLTIGGPPAPITLAIYLQDDGTLRFEQTEITRKYLGNEGCVEESERVAAMA